MTRDELKLIISIKQRKFINAIIKIGLKKASKHPFLYTIQMVLMNLASL